MENKTMEYITSNLNTTLLVGLICVFIVLLLVYIPHFLTCRKIKLKNGDEYTSNFLTPSWIVTSVWVGVLCFVLVMDGNFLHSGLASHIVWASIIMSAITVIGSKLENFGKIKISKGNINLEAWKDEKDILQGNTRKKHRKNGSNNNSI